VLWAIFSVSDALLKYTAIKKPKQDEFQHKLTIPFHPTFIHLKASIHKIINMIITNSDKMAQVVI